MKRKDTLIYLIMIILVAIDQIIKYIVASNMDLLSSISIIDNFFSITYVINDGAAWNLLSGNQLFLILISLCACVAIYIYFIKDKVLSILDKILFGLLYSGIIGNLLDRIVRGNVIDYLDFKILGYNFPVFNLADICIVISTILIVILAFRGDKNENNNNL